MTSGDPLPSSWREPEAAITHVLDAPPTPWILLSPDAAHVLLVDHEPMPRLSDVARPRVKLAGLRIDAQRDARHQLAFGTGLVLRDLRGKRERRIALPAGRRIASLGWSHDSQAFALVLDGGGPGELWWGSLDAPEPRFVAAGLHAVLGDGFAWMPEGARVLATFVPAERAPAPCRPAVAGGPDVLEARGERTPLRTHQDLLRDEHDELLFVHHATSQLALVDLAAGRVEPIGAPGLVASYEASPDGRWVLVSTVVEPFSRLHTVSGFGYVVDAREIRGALGVRERIDRADSDPGGAASRRGEASNSSQPLSQRIAAQPVAENVPIEGVRTGPRAVQWSAHGDARIVWVEALDGGDPRTSVPHRDRWMALDEPFTSAAREILRVEHRASGLSWLADGTTMLAREWDRERRWTRLWMAAPGTPSSSWVALDDRSVNDAYGDPGSILFEPRARGRRIVRQRGAWIFRIGAGAEESGARPFLDRQRLDVPAGEMGRERMFQSAAGEHERPIALVDTPSGEAIAAFVTRHESPLDPPNLRLRKLDSPAFEHLTHFPDPAPFFRRVRKELVRYERADGVRLSGTLHLPPDWDGARLPLVMWAYPREYVDADTASQVRGTPHDFTRVSGPSPLFFLMRGYAVLEDAEMPVVGPPETMNDTFLEQIVASARAAIAHLDGIGVCDPKRVGVGGHSYGAFMAVCLLAHSDLFRAGIARSGAYNRTLTPFGFQSERRTLWEAPKSYVELSPLLAADKIRAPLLLVHGAEDENPGTHVIQTERLFQAIRGTGGLARFVSLPHEGHGYRSREAILHVLAEMLDWFDAHVRTAVSDTLFRQQRV